ncbi:MAG: response regulator [Bacteroidales bacterium]|nr:response regulator [Bacteroidales bacterium]
MRRTIVILLFSIQAIALWGSGYDIDKLTNSDGLSNSSVNTIFQDSSGLMWFGTWDGLNIYDGEEFKVFKPEPNDNGSISNNIIRDVIEQRPGIEWIATDRGINRYDASTGRFERFFSDLRNGGVTFEHSFLILKNKEDVIFSIVYDQGTYYFDEEKHSFILLPEIGKKYIKKAFFDADDNMWLYTEDKRILKVVFEKGHHDSPVVEAPVDIKSLCNMESVFYDAKGNTIWMQTPEKGYVAYEITEGLLSDSNSDFYRETGPINDIAFKDTYQLLGTSRGLFHFNPKDKSLSCILNNVPVLSVFAGSQQIIWVGTDMQGVWILSQSNDKFITYPQGEAGIFNHCAVRCFYEDDQGNLWVGTKGSGIYVFRHKEGKQGLRAHYGTENGILNNSVYAIVKGKSEIWIGTDGRGINYYDNARKRIFTLDIPDSLRQGINLSSIYSILPQGNDTLWVGTSGYGMYRLTIDHKSMPYSIKSYRQYVYREGKPSLSNNIVYSIIKDDSTHLWIATRGGGLNRFDRVSSTFQVFHFWSNDSSFISSDDVLCLCRDSRKRLWAGTSMGLYQLLSYTGNKPYFSHFTEKEGMPNNTIHGIMEDSNHNLWLSTNRGIAKLITDSINQGHRIISYYKSDGLQDNEFSDGAFYKSPGSNLMYFGGINGYNVFNPQDISNSSYMPSLVMDAFYVDNEKAILNKYIQNVGGKRSLYIKYNNKSFSFRFIPIDYLTGDKCEISYFLEGYQKEWINLGTSNTVVFSNLRPGHYTLKVRCSNADKLWSNNLYVLPVRISPPWYASTAAIICYILLFLLVCFGIYKFISYKISVKEKIRDEENDKKKIEEIHEAKLVFFTNIAHEFSNSLTLIYGPCEQLLMDKSLPSDEKKYLNVIESNSDRMQSLIQQLIEFRKAENGHLKVHIEPVDIVELAKCESDYYLDILEQRHIIFNLHFSQEKIVWPTDRDCCDKVIFNLISNAVKYTREGEHIDVSVSITDCNFLRLEVKNTGIGVRKEYQKSIFDRFEVLNRFEKEVSKGETSNGIGLSLCKSIVELLKGEITIDSDENSFTSFIVTLPVLECSQNGTGEQQNLKENNVEKDRIRQIKEATQQSQGKNANMGESLASLPLKKEGLVLIVDDDREIRKFIKDILGNRFDTAEASNGKEAIDMMKKKMPNLIICDVIMPVMDGVEFVRTMKSQELTHHIPIILLSAKSSVENQIEGLEMGADAYLGKPFHPRHLNAVIDSLLDRDKALLDYSKSAYSAVEQFEGNIVKKEDKNLITSITEVIYNNIDSEKLSIDLIANETAISKMQLYRKVKELLNMTPTEYIRQIRLEQAEKLLKTTNKTVQEIMYECGFNSKTYFYREFSRKYHLTPKEYRSNNA